MTWWGRPTPWRCWLAATTCARRGRRFRHRWLGLTLGVKVVADVNEGARPCAQTPATRCHPDQLPRQCRRFVNGAGSAAVWRQRLHPFHRRRPVWPRGPRWRSRPRCFTPVAPWGWTELTSYKWVGQAVNQPCLIQARSAAGQCRLRSAFLSFIAHQSQWLAAYYPAGCGVTRGIRASDSKGSNLR